MKYSNASWIAYQFTIHGKLNPENKAVAAVCWFSAAEKKSLLTLYQFDSIGIYYIQQQMMAENLDVKPITLSCSCWDY